MKVKYIIVFMIGTYVSLFATEVDTFKKTLQEGECKDYYVEDKTLDSIFFWMKSVDDLKECDEKSVSLVSSNTVLSIVTSNMVILKKNYHYCKDIKDLSKIFKTKKSKVLEMRKNLNTTCKEVFEKKVDYVKKLENLKKAYAKDKKNLHTLNEEKKEVTIIEKNVLETKKILEDKILETKKRMEVIEKKIKGL